MTSVARWLMRLRSPPLAIVLALAGGCVGIRPAATAGNPRIAWLEAVLTDTARVRGREWRERQYPAADLHGPFPRPALADTSDDPNDAFAYYRAGLVAMDSAPGLADRAFYWATRIDPYFADAYYARWVLLRQRWPWRLFPDSTIRRRDDAAAEAADSLLARATMYEPFVDEPMNFSRLAPYFGSRGRPQRDPFINGARAYVNRDYRRAVDLWGRVLRADAEALFVRVPRAYAWVRLANADSAIAELSQVVERLERLQRDSLVAPYRSKERLHYAIGFLHARQARPAEARAAYVRALAENLGFYMAHVRLAGVSLTEHDTTTALTAMETALLINPDDPFVATFYGALLTQVGRPADARRWYEAAIRADSDYALPRLYLGQLFDRGGDTLRARQHYAAYLARAARTAPDREWARARLQLTP